MAAVVFLIESSPLARCTCTGSSASRMRSGRSAACEDVALGEDHGALDGVLELAHVARPRVLEQELARLRVEAPRLRVPEAGVVARDEVVDEQAHVLARDRAAAGCGWEDVDAVEEVLAEAPGLRRRRPRSRCVAAMMRTSTLMSLVSPRRRMCSSWSDAQELHLQVERQLADLVEEERAAVGLLEEAAAVGRGVGEGALACARRARSRAGSRGWRRS